MSKFSKLVNYVLIFFLVFSLAGCKETEQEEIAEEAVEEKPETEIVTPTEPIVEEEQQTEETTEEEAEEETANPILNYGYDIASYDDDAPHRYRACNSELKKADEKYEMDTNYVPSTKGLEETYMSGSAEFSPDQFEVLVNNLKTISKGEIYIVDLRQENHLYIDGQSVYWDGSNEDLSTDEVLANEQELEAELKELLPDHEIMSEQELVEEYGLNYVRIASKDNHFPSPEVVDEFLDFVKTLPKNAWLHFHCKEGKGRTTTFMAMYDIYKNKGVSLKDVAYRQYCIGGIYVLYDGSREEDTERIFCEEREEYITLFYDYVHRNILKNGQSWSEWLENNG